MVPNVVVSRAGRTVAVSRFGSEVRLLPGGVAFAAWPLWRRLHFADAALAVPVDLPLAGGALPAEVRLAFAAGGVLPVPASAVRERGWDAAWRGERVLRETLTPFASRAASRGEQWRRIFPGATSELAVDVTAALAPVFSSAASAAKLERAEVHALADPFVTRLAAAEIARRAPAPGRLVVLGLDALDWRLVDELGARGGLPHLRALAARGAAAVIDVPKPLISPVIWTTIATGVEPAQHGVLDFLESGPRAPGAPPQPVTSATRRVPALWEMAAAAGRSSAVIGWWATYPAEAPPGARVYSDRLTEQLFDARRDVPRLAAPPEAEADAHRVAIRPQQVSLAMLRPLAPVGAADLARITPDAKDPWIQAVGRLARLEAATRNVEAFTQIELARGTQVLLSYLEGTDIVGHSFAAYRPPALPDSDPILAARLGGTVDAYYARTDAWVGRVAAALDPTDTLVVVSDHGFTWGDDRPRVPSGADTATATWWHRAEGVFIAAGPAVRRNGQRQRLRTIDVAPSLLALAALPHGAGMPGAAPEWLLAEPRIAGQMRVAWSELLPRAERATGSVRDAGGDAEQLAKLRALGYIGGAPAAASGAPANANEAPTPPAAPDIGESRRLNNLAGSLAESDPRRAETTYRAAIAADPGYAAPRYNLALLLLKDARYDEADEQFWAAVDRGLREAELAAVQLALAYRAQKQADRGTQTLTRARERFPRSAFVWNNSGVYAAEQKRLDEAWQFFERAVALDPTDQSARRNLEAARKAR